MHEDIDTEEQKQALALCDEAEQWWSHEAPSKDLTLVSALVSALRVAVMRIEWLRQERNMAVVEHPPSPSSLSSTSESCEESESDDGDRGTELIAKSCREAAEYVLPWVTKAEVYDALHLIVSAMNPPLSDICAENLVAGIRKRLGMGEVERK